MSRPVVSDAAERAYAALHPYHGTPEQEEASGWLLLHFCEAAARTRAKTTEALVFDDAGSGQRRMLSVDRAPGYALEWLAQFTGLRQIPPGLTESQTRQLIRNAPGLRRGTLDAIAGAAGLFLTGDRRVRVKERDGSAWRMTVITYQSQTPNPAATEAAIRSQKPIGIVLTYLVAQGWAWDEMVAHYSSQTWAQMAADNSSWQALVDHLPD